MRYAAVASIFYLFEIFIAERIYNFYDEIFDNQNRIYIN